MHATDRIVPILFVGIIVAMHASAHAAFDLSFTNGDAFDGHTDGSTAGPFTDLDTGVAATFRTVDIENGTSWNSAGSQNGIIGNGTNSTQIDGGEAWVFEWDKASKFLFIDMSALAGGFNAAIQSDAWIGAVIVAGDDTHVAFDSTTGTFSFNGNESGDGFDATEMYGSSTIPLVPAGTNYRLFTLNNSGYAIGTGFTFEFIPEPATIGLTVVGFALMGRRRRHRSCLQSRR